MKRRSFLAALFAAPFIPTASDAFRSEGKSPADALHNKARISHEVQARADADSAFACNIGTLQAGVLRSADGCTTLDLSTGAILIA